MLTFIPSEYTILAPLKRESVPFCVAWHTGLCFMSTYEKRRLFLAIRLHWQRKIIVLLPTEYVYVKPTEFQERDNDRMEDSYPTFSFCQITEEDLVIVKDKKWAESFLNYIWLIMLLQLFQFFSLCPSSTQQPPLPQAIPPPLFMSMGHACKSFACSTSCTVLYIPTAIL